MKEELQTKVLEEIGNMAEMTKEGLMKAVEVIQEQCPLLIEELLEWESVVSAIWCSLWFIGGLVFLVLFVMSVISTKKDEDWLPACFISIILWIVCSLGVVNTCQWLQIQIAPRLFLLEYLRELL